MPGQTYRIVVDREHIDSNHDLTEALHLLEEQLAARPAAREGTVEIESWGGGCHQIDAVVCLKRDGERLIVAYDNRRPPSPALPLGPRGARSRPSGLGG